MAFSFDDESRTRELSRTGAVLALRAPLHVYGVSAFVLHLCVGMVAMLWAASGDVNFTSDDAQFLAVTALIASTVTAATVGSALYRNEISGAAALVFRTSVIWAALAAVWPLSTLLPDLFDHAGTIGSVDDLTKPVIAQGARMLASAWEGALGGGAAALVVSLLCVERRE